MRISSLLPAACAGAAFAAYPGDIVQYWVDQSAILVNGAVYDAAVNSANETLAFQQLAVSHAAHDSLHWTFHGARLYAAIDAAFSAVAIKIGINASSADARRAREIGEDAANRVTAARTNDGMHGYVAYTPLPAEPGNYQGRPGGPRIPDTPQAQQLRLFGGLVDMTKYRAPPPPAPESPEFEKYLIQVYEQGGNNSVNRTEYDTETAWFWLESSPIGWNRLANLVVGDSLAKNVTASARFYAVLNYALANAAIASWDTKYFYGSWRPITALNYDASIYLASNTSLVDPSGTPLLNPTPNHQDYLSTHATFGAAAGAVISLWNGGDEIDVQLSSNVTRIEQVVRRRTASIKQAVKDNGDSRIFGGIHFQYASDVGNEIGWWVGEET
ncbi:hypothetical protein Q7P35_002803 [Cladosporium inversicolor]